MEARKEKEWKDGRPTKTGPGPNNGIGQSANTAVPSPSNLLFAEPVEGQNPRLLLLKMMFLQYLVELACLGVTMARGNSTAHIGGVAALKLCQGMGGASSLQHSCPVESTADDSSSSRGGGGGGGEKKGK